MDDMSFVANRNLIELTSPQVESVENKSLESTAKLNFIEIRSISGRALVRIFLSSDASPVASVLAEVADLKKRREICEFQEKTWKTDPISNFPNRIPDRKESCP